MHAPDKLAFLAGSDQAMPFPSPPSYPEKTNYELSERQCVPDNTAISLLRPAHSWLENMSCY